MRFDPIRVAVDRTAVARWTFASADERIERVHHSRPYRWFRAEERVGEPRCARRTRSDGRYAALLVATAGVLAAAAIAVSAADAQELRIVALGASQTAGKGVPAADAYPAQLERVLKGEGYAATVVNDGNNGDTTRELLARVDSALGGGTRVLIVQPGTNDRQRTNRRDAVAPDETRRNVEAMLDRAKAKGVPAILLGFPGEGGKELARERGAIWYGQPRRDTAPEMTQSDGQHLTVEGYAVLARNLAAVIREIVGAAK